MIAEHRGRQEAIGRLATLIEGRARHATLRVAIDGVDAAGKTTLADELAAFLEQGGGAVLRASIDGFHNPASVRHHRAGEQPARSYYEDSFDYPALRRCLLDPLGPSGHNIVRTRVFDFRANESVDEAPVRVQPGTVLVFDGVFLLRPELDGCWDLSLFIEIDPAVSLARALQRDRAVYGTADAIEQRYRERYLPGQEIYLSVAHPDERADVLIDNNDPTAAETIRIPVA